MSLTQIQNEVFRLAGQGLSVKDIVAHLRKEAKESGQIPVPTAWVRAWLHNAGFQLRKPTALGQRGRDERCHLSTCRETA